MRLLVVDPGIRGCGVAWFLKGELEEAAYIKNPVKKGNGPEACLGMASEIEFVGRTPHELVVEWPQVYTQGLLKGDPNDLLALVGVNMALCALLGVKTTRYLPREWKGQMQKGDAFTKRVRDRLSPAEQNAIEDAGALTHNIIDAVGIGLFHLGRFDRKRVFPR